MNMKKVTEGELRLTISIILFCTIPVVANKPIYIGIVTIVGIYALVTGIIRMKRKKK